MNIYRIHPGLDAFVIHGVYLPYIDIIAETEEKALNDAYRLMPGLDSDSCCNSLNFIELIGKR